MSHPHRTVIKRQILLWQNPSVGLNTTEVRPMMSPELAAMPSPTLSPDPLAASPSQAMCPELEEAWMELLSLPELQVWCGFRTYRKNSAKNAPMTGRGRSQQKRACACRGNRRQVQEAGFSVVTIHLCRIVQRFSRLYEKKPLWVWMLC